MLTEAAPAVAPPVPDLESRRWLDGLAAGDSDAVARLHSLLLRAARFELWRRRGMLHHVSYDEVADLALQSADDALVSILSRLGDYRGASRFTTWAYKFALLEAGVKARRRAWHGREVALEAGAWNLLPDQGAAPVERAEQEELFAALRAGLETALTRHQREVLVAIVLNGVPIDVLAERLGTTRGALYKTVHDARRRLRAHLRTAGYTEVAA